MFVRQDHVLVSNRKTHVIAKHWNIAVTDARMQTKISLRKCMLLQNESRKSQFKHEGTFAAYLWIPTNLKGTPVLNGPTRLCTLLQVSRMDVKQNANALFHSSFIACINSWDKSVWHFKLFLIKLQAVQQSEKVVILIYRSILPLKWASEETVCAKICA